MLIATDTFLLCGIISCLFYIIRKNLRPYILLAASLVFIGRLGFNTLVWALSFSAALYLIGLTEQHFLSIDKKRAAKAVMITGLVLCIFFLFALKYAIPLHLDDRVFQSFILPVGFSYYTFQGISYLVDIYREKLPAERNPLILLLYMCFFPKFLSGPIERPDEFLKQIRNLDKVLFFADNRIPVAFASLLYGLFMKLVVADRLAMLTQRLFNNPQFYGSRWLFCGMLMYVFQIYCDFAGYSAIAVAFGRLFGITLTENFHAPYLSRNIAEFWRRWHISLSGWLRDYIYIPLGGSKKGIVRQCINIMIVFILCGLWHGTGFNFLLWGGLHGLYQICHIVLTKTGVLRRIHIPAVPGNILGTAITFLCVSTAWIFFGISNAKGALDYVARMLTAGVGETPMLNQIHQLIRTNFDRRIPIYLIFVILLDVLIVRKQLPFGEAVMKLPGWTRYLLEYVMIVGIFLLGVYGPGYDPTEFLYMSF